MKVKAKLKPVRFFRALADETRLRILNLLEAGELCVCDLVTVLDAPQPTVSRHLSYLRKTGLVTVRKHGVWCYYSLAPADTEFRRHLLACIDCCEWAKMAKDVATLKRNRGICCD